MKHRWQVVQYDGKTFITWYPCYTWIGAWLTSLFIGTKYPKSVERCPKVQD